MTRFDGRRAAARSLSGVAVLLLASALTLSLVEPSRADSTASWGPQGLTTTDSPVTVSWDNSGNPAGDVVPRDASQVLPHTGGKTYADVDPTVSNAVRGAYGNLKVTVSQTQNLVHQVVNLAVTGVDGTANPYAFLEAFQCWGEPNDTAPDPTHCQTGVGGFDGSSRDLNRSILPSDTSLTAGGDLKATTQLTLTGALVGGGAQLTATLTASQVGASTLPVATGAKGTVEFDKADGTVLAKGVPISNGVATQTVPNIDPSVTTTFMATYTATPGENYVSTTTLQQLTLPSAIAMGTLANSASPVIAGAVYTISLPAHTFATNHVVTASLDGSTPTPLASTDDFGTLAARYTVPADLTSGVSHFLKLSDGTTIKTTYIQISSPTSVSGGAGTNSNPDKSAGFALQTVGGTWAPENDRQYMSPSTVNELVNILPAGKPADVTNRGFEMQTGAEAAGLGCGFRSDEPSTNTCWLVIVPRGFAGENSGDLINASALTPSRWAQRLQVKLGFADVAPTCPGGQARTIALGGEVLGSAMASWIPAICATDKVALGFSQLAESTARAQYSTGSANFIFTSQPVDDSGGATSTRYAPVALAGTVVAVRMFPVIAGQANPPMLSDIKLNARLVAKLLTQSYSQSVDNFPATRVGDNAPWVNDELASLTADPEFLALNPGIAQYFRDNGDLIVAINPSDAVSVLWQWITGDPEARAFLDGCPDDASGGSVINPFFSTRTYAECTGRTAALETAAQAKMDQTAVPSTYTYSTPSYPPPDGGFPQPGYYARQATSTQLSETTTDLHPRQLSLDAVGLNVYKGNEPTSAWCAVSDGCTGVAAGQPGKWSSASSPGYYNVVSGVTTTVTSARYQNVTASLCDDAGHCVGANTASLQKAAAAFTAADGSPVQPTTVPDIASGAYPLTTPIYAEVNTLNLSAQDAKSIATALATITGPGQTAGTESGQLPPGYAPVTAAQAVTAAATVTALTAIAGPASPTPTATATPSSSPSTDTGATPDTGSIPPGGPVPNAQPSSVVSSPSAPAAPQPTPSSGGVVTTPVTPSVSETPATKVGFPRLGVVGTAVGGLAAAAAVPIFGRRRKGPLQ